MILQGRTCVNESYDRRVAETWARGKSNACGSAFCLCRCVTRSVFGLRVTSANSPGRSPTRFRAHYRQTMINAGRQSGNQHELTAEALRTQRNNWTQMNTHPHGSRELFAPAAWASAARCDLFSQVPRENALPSMCPIRIGTPAHATIGSCCPILLEKPHEA